MKILNRVFIGISLFLSVIPIANSAAWLNCGKLNQITSSGITGYPLDKYEYAIAYNTKEPIPIVITQWNVGIRVANKEPYFTFSDNPTSMKWGGFVFYSGTSASDDNCGIGNFRHKYWRIDANSNVIADHSNGCYGSTGSAPSYVGTNTGVGSNPIIYCRVR